MPRIAPFRPLRTAPVTASSTTPLPNARQADWAEFASFDVQLWLFSLAAAITYGLYLIRL